MMIAGGEPELCYGTALRGMLSERVGSMYASMHYVYVSLVQKAVCTCMLCEKEFV